MTEEEAPALRVPRAGVMLHLVQQRPLPPHLLQLQRPTRRPLGEGVPAGALGGRRDKQSPGDQQRCVSLGG